MYADEFAELLRQVKEKNLKIDLRIFTAFSRDTATKVYVQHRLAENGAQVWANLQTGYFYICGYVSILYLYVVVVIHMFLTL